MLLPARVQTDHLLLRNWTVEDAPTLGALVTDNADHLRPWMPWIALEPLSLDERIDLITRWEQQRTIGGDTLLGVFLLDGTPIGSCGLHTRRGPGVLEIGYWIAEEHTGRGHATDVARALTIAAFEHPGTDRVEIHHDRDNVRSGRVPAKLGYAFADETAREVEAPGESGVSCRWVMTRDDWPARSGTSHQ